MNNESYYQEMKKIICDICNKIIQEKLYIVAKDENESFIKGKPVLKISIKNNEWYNNLDENTRLNVEFNLQKIFEFRIQEAINEYNKEKNSTILENDVDFHENINKRQKLI